MDLRYFYLSKNYRQQLNFTWKNLENSKNSLERLKNIILGLDKDQKKNKKNIESARKQFSRIMDNDLNFPRALSFLWEILRDNRLRDSEKYELALDFDNVFGLELGKEEKIKIPEEIKKIAEERKKARKEKNWKKADELREKIKKKGYQINDTKEGYIIKKILWK